MYGPAVTGPAFVSYSHHDHLYVAKLAAYLRAAGVTVWTDEGIDYGSEWASVTETPCGCGLPGDLPRWWRSLTPLDRCGPRVHRLVCHSARHHESRTGRLPSARVAASVGIVPVLPLASPHK